MGPLSGPAFGASSSVVAAAVESLGLASGSERVTVTVVDDTCPFLYLSFDRSEVAAAVREMIDRRSPSSKPFLGRVVQADFAEADLAVTRNHGDSSLQDSLSELTPQQLLVRLQRSLTPLAQEDEAGVLPEAMPTVIPTQAPVHCPLCHGDPYAIFGRGRAFRMHLKSPVHGIEEGPLMLRIVELAQKEADIAEARRKEDELEEDDNAPGPPAPGASGPVPAEDPGLAAARDGQLEDLQQLVCRGWDPVTATDRHGSTALHYAAGAGHLQVCRYLIKDCGVPAGQSCTTGRRDSRNALHWAARNGHTAVCSFLVEYCGVDINSTTSDGTNAFHWAVWQARFEVCRWLVDSGCNWRRVNDWGCTAVHWAALQGNLPMLWWLHRHGLDLNHRNNQGHSALHKAAYKGHTDVCQWLLGDAVTADPRLVDQGGYTPATIARLQHHGELADLLEAASQRIAAAVAGAGGEGVPAGQQTAETEYVLQGPLGVLKKIE
mmetsp:Transcript_38496/g.108805  ORF Transcript_38496/g.108805 Transcript_38496/m.108805 type:complete len:491 (-) Transcript_38496:232-1704(-)